MNSIIDNRGQEGDEVFSWEVEKQLEFIHSHFRPTMEPAWIRFFPVILEKSSQSRTGDLYKELGKLLVQKMNPYSWTRLLPLLLESMSSIQWQVKHYALCLIVMGAEHHPQIIAQNMPEIIQQLIVMTNEPKKEIKQQTLTTFQAVCKTIENVDIRHLIPVMIKAYMNPSQETQNALDALVSTPFVNDIDIPTDWIRLKSTDCWG